MYEKTVSYFLARVIRRRYC